MSGDFKNRERIANYMLEGYSNAVIASRLNLKVKSVKFHITKIFKAYNVTSRAQFIAQNSQSYNLKLKQSKIDSLTKELESCRLELKNAKDRLYSIGLPMGVK